MLHSLSLIKSIKLLEHFFHMFRSSLLKHKALLSEKQAQSDANALILTSSTVIVYSYKQVNIIGMFQETSMNIVLSYNEAYCLFP